MDLQELFKLTIEKKASDLHIIPGYVPSIRVHDKLLQLKSMDALTPEKAKTMLFSILEAT